MPQPQRQWASFPSGGPLDESLTPSRVGGSALTDCNNLIYSRTNAWGKRSGSTTAYEPASPAFSASPNVSGVRWYRPSELHPLTQLVISANAGLWTGNNPGSTLQRIYDFQDEPSQPVSFCAAYDPNQNNGNGGGILIIAGADSLESFGTDSFIITGQVGQGPSATIYMTLMQNGAATPIYAPPGAGGYGGSPPGTSAQIQVLPTDNPSTIAANIVSVINQSIAVPGGTGNNPLVQRYMGQAYSLEGNLNPVTGSANATVYMGALFSGTVGNSITWAIKVSGSFGTGSTIGFFLSQQDGGGPVDTTGGTAYKLSGGGQPTSAPLKYDGNTVSGLSYQITKPFTRCVTWHDHVWLWGSKKDLDTLFATDINQPEGFVFMNTYGGYQVGAGDGDPDIQNCFPAGNSLYIVKTASIYPMNGYDFQVGEYSFNIQPAIFGYGIPSPQCGAVVENMLYFWTGRKFCRLQVGSYQPEHIGSVIPLTEGRAAAGNQGIIRCVGGSFTALTQLNNVYTGGAPNVSAIQSQLVLWAVDDGTGAPNLVVAFDNEATTEKGHYSWTKWTGWSVAYWIAFGQGPNSNQSDADKPILCWLPYAPHPSVEVEQYGSQVALDYNGAVIPWRAQTGYITAGTAMLQKNMDWLQIELQATNGAAMVASIVTAQGNLPNIQLADIPTVQFVPADAPEGCEAFNVLQQQIERSVVAPGYMFTFTEDGTSKAGFELVSFSFDCIQEAITH